MMQKGVYSIYAMLCGVLVICAVSCENPDFSKPDKKPAPTDTIRKDTTTVQQDTASTSKPKPQPQDTTGYVLISVQMAKLYAEGVMKDTSLIVKADGLVGYIVGDINGTSISNAEFAPPFNRESNIIIADDPLEKDISKCMPVELPQNTRFRKELNLKTNPGNYGRRVVLEGSIADYFKTVGIKNLVDYHWVKNNSDEDTTQTTRFGNPTISTKPETILGGR